MNATTNFYEGALLVLRSRTQPILDLNLTSFPEPHVNINSCTLFIVENGILKILSNIIRLSYDLQRVVDTHPLQSTQVLLSEDRACA